MCNWNAVRACVGIVLLTAAWEPVSKADVVVMSDPNGGASHVAAGNGADAEQLFCPASTFKIIIALAALEKDPSLISREMDCSDAHLPRKPMHLTFREAMYYSSNEYFVPLVQSLKPDEIAGMARRCWFGSIPPGGKFPRDIREWIHGGPIRIKPVEQQKFFQYLVNRQLPVDSKVQAAVLKTLEWPSQSGAEVAGKTGSWEKTFWFTGAAAWGKRARVITVMLNSPGSSRDKAIATFHEWVEKEKP